jgi:hypothetical protein
MLSPGDNAVDDGQRRLGSISADRPVAGLRMRPGKSGADRDVATLGSNGLSRFAAVGVRGHEPRAVGFPGSLSLSGAPAYVT